MKTTIDLPDALAAEARAVARAQGASLRELVVAGLRSESGPADRDFSYFPELRTRNPFLS